MPIIFAILPCYNEALNIEDLTKDWLLQERPLLQKQYSLQVIIIDDCSTDNTMQKILELEQKYENVKLVAHETNKGLCGGLNTAISYFLKYGSADDLMVLMDGDNTHSPKYIHTMLEKLMDGKDCVISSRYCKNSSIVGVARHREFLSDMAKHYYSILLRIPGVKDYTCGYRIYTYPIIKKLVERFGDAPIKEQSFACMMELLYKLYLVGAAFGEIGFQLRYDNKQGKSKMHVIKTIRSSLTTALKLRRIKK